MSHNPNRTSSLTSFLCRARLVLLFIAFISSTLAAQPFDLKKKVADRYYDRFEYYKAIPMYKELNALQPYNLNVIEKLAESHFRINDSENAEFWLKLLTDSMPNSQEFVLQYAQTLARNGKYKLSGEWYARYAELNPNDNRGLAFSNAYNNVSQFYTDSLSYVTRKLLFNSSFSDFSPMYYKNGLVFSSAREKKGAIRLWYSWTNSSYLDLFFAFPDSTQTTEFMPGLNSLYHEGPVTFNKTADTIYFTRSNFYKFMFRKSADKINKLEVFQAVRDSVKKEWINAVPLSFNNKQFSSGHPALSPDGNKLYFVSDMSGGFGGTDIYVTTRSTDEKGKTIWSTPENLGKTINTCGNEMFPYIDVHGNLYFSSNGHPGLGGLDVFFAAKSDTTFVAPKNLGYPVNTNYDDFGLIASATGKDGYLSSDRFNDVGNDDIYRWKKISRNLILYVYDNKSLVPVSSTAINISTIAADPIIKISNNEGVAPLTIQPSKPYQFNISKEKYVDKKLELTASQLSELDTVKLALERKIPKFKLVGKVYGQEDKTPLKNALATVVNLADSSVYTASTDSSGTFNFDLQPEAVYNISIAFSATGKKCGTSSASISTVGVDNDNTFYEMFPVLCVGDVIKIENIYYDLGKFNIRTDAAKELDKVLDLMAKYPKMKIELRSHTDSRGSDAANMTLSDKRAKAAVAYLVSKGVVQSQIVGKGYGESIPINRCTNGVKCSDEEFQANRRTEFKVLSIE